MEPWVPFQPAQGLRMFVGRVVVGDEVDVERRCRPSNQWSREPSISDNRRDGVTNRTSQTLLSRR
jgi:hypothetical protein